MDLMKTVQVKQTSLKSVYKHMTFRYEYVKIKDNGPLLAATDFKIVEFWVYLGTASSKLSDEITKFAVLYSNDPMPSETEAQSILIATETAFENVITTFLTLPKSHGETLYDLAHTLVLEVIEAVIAVIKSVIDTGRTGQENRLKLVGVVWETCKLISETSFDNSTAVLKIIKTEELLLMDALLEMEEEMAVELLILQAEDGQQQISQQPVDQPDTDQAGGGDCIVDELHETSSQWTHEDRLLIAPSRGLARTARYCLKKLHDIVSCRGPQTCCVPAWISEFDTLASKVKAFSPAVDDFVLSVYPPANRLETRAATSTLVTLIRSTLQLARESHYVTEEDQEKLDFLLKALDHNNSKIQPLLNVHNITASV